MVSPGDEEDAQRHGSCQGGTAHPRPSPVPLLADQPLGGADVVGLRSTCVRASSSPPSTRPRSDAGALVRICLLRGNLRARRSSSARPSRRARISVTMAAATWEPPRAQSLAGCCAACGELRLAVVVCQPGYRRSTKDPAWGLPLEVRRRPMAQLDGGPARAGRRTARTGGDCGTNGASRPSGPCSAWAASTWPSSACQVWHTADCSP